MAKHKIAVILIFLIFASNFSLVSATVSQNSGNADEVKLVHVYVSTTGNDNGKGSASDPFQSLSKAIDGVDQKGSIHVANGVYKGNFNRNLVINKDINIISDGSIPGVGNNVLIDAESLEKIFTTTDSINFNVEGIVFTNANAPYGSVLNNNAANVTFTNCKILNNHGDGYGGAILNEGNLNLINCIFNSNVLNKGEGSFGGAIANFGTLNVVNSEFYSNIAGITNSGTGGAIYNTGDLVVQNSIFNLNMGGNELYGTGGAIANTGDLNIFDSTFKANEAGSDIGGSGGALSNSGTLNVKDTSFVSNVAGKNVGSKGAGGAVCNMNNSATFSHCAFSNNIGGTGGGAIYSLSNLVIDDSSFVSNQAGSYGGAIVNSNLLTLTNCQASSNSADYGGFIDNGAYENNPITCTVRGGIFKDNNAKANGGTFYNTLFASLDIGSAEITDNYAMHCGGGIFNKGILILQDVLIQQNTANMESGGGIENQGNATIDSLTATGNKGCYGGAINNFQNMSVQNSIINKNSACISGCGISNNGYMDIYNSIVTENIAKSDTLPNSCTGGGISNNGYMELNKLIITKNQATYGAGIFNYIRDTTGILKIRNSNINNNTANKTGGGIQNNFLVFADTNTIINDNTPNNVNGQPITPRDNINKQTIDKIIKQKPETKYNNFLFVKKKDVSKNQDKFFDYIVNQRNYSTNNLFNWN